MPRAGPSISISRRALSRCQVQAQAGHSRAWELAQLALGLQPGADVAAGPGQLAACQPVGGPPPPGGVGQVERGLRFVEALPLGHDARLRHQVGGPGLAPESFRAPFQIQGPGEVAGEEKGHGLLRGRGIARQACQALEGRRGKRAAGELAPLHDPVELPAEPLRRLGTDRAGGAVRQGRVQQVLIARIRAHLAGNGEIVAARLAQVPLVEMLVGLGEPGLELRPQRPVPAHLGGAEPRPVAAAGEELLHPLPGPRVRGERGHQGLLVGGRGEPGIEERPEVLRVAQQLGHQDAGALPFARREGRPDLQVGRGQEAERLALGRRQAAGREERLLPVLRRGEEARVAGVGPPLPGGGAEDHGGLPRDRPACQDLARLPRRLLQPGGALPQLRPPLRRRRVERTGALHLARQHRPGRPQPHAVRVRLTRQLPRQTRVDPHSRAFEPGGLRLPLAAQGVMAGEREQRQDGRESGAGEAQSQGEHGSIVPHRFPHGIMAPEVCTS